MADAAENESKGIDVVSAMQTEMAKSGRSISLENVAIDDSLDKNDAALQLETNINNEFADIDSNNIDLIDETIKKVAASNEIMVFSKTYCPFCLELKRTLQEYNVPYKLVELDIFKIGGTVQSQLTTITGQSTVPHIYINNNHIGGCDSFKTYIKEGKFESIIDKYRNNDEKDLDVVKQLESELYKSQGNAIKNEENAAFQCLFAFPSSVNNYTIRILGLQSFVICILALIFHNNEFMHWVLFALFIDYTTRFVSGPAFSPMALFANILVSQLEPKFSPGAPKQFAALCGMMFSGFSWLLLAVFGQIEAGCTVIAILLICAGMEGILDFCVGCFFFKQIVRLKLIRPSVYKLHINTRAEKVYMYKDAYTRLKEGPYTAKSRFVDESNPSTSDLYYKIKSDYQKQEDFDVIRHMRVSMFLLVLGVSALSLVWRLMADMSKYYNIGYDDIYGTDIDRTVSDILFVASLVLFGVFSGLYVIRLVLHSKKCVKEFQHATMVGYFSAIPVNIMCYVYLAYDRDDLGPKMFYKVIFWMCAFAVLLITIHSNAVWLQRRLTLEDIDPTWLMVPVANFITVFIGVVLDNEYLDELWLWFSFGMIMVCILVPITFYKVIVNANSDDRRRNGILIWCAVPVFAGLAYEGLSQEINNFSLVMYWSSLLFALIMFELMLNKFIGRARFDTSYYSYGFSFCSSAIAAIKINDYDINYDSNFYNYISYIFIAIACLAVVVNVMHTVYGLFQLRVMRPVIPKWGVLSFMKLSHEAFRGWVKRMNQLLDENNDISTVNMDKITAEWNLCIMVHHEHARMEDEIIFTEAKTLFPEFTDVAEHDHEEHDVIIERINGLITQLRDSSSSGSVSESELNEMKKNIIGEIREFCKELLKHLLWEESHITPIARKYMPIELQKKMIERVWSLTSYDKWSVMIPWILRNQEKIPQRVLFLKALMWAMPYRCQMLGLIVYRGCNDVLWADIAQELPEIIPRGVKGWRRQY